MSNQRRNRSPWLWIALLVGLAPSGARCQEAANQASAGSPGGDEGPSISDSTVGYIDPAIPTNQVRFRYDAAFDLREPTRGEYFFARTGPHGPGLPLPESRVDYQEVALYLERTFGTRFSAFVDLPVRFDNYAINVDQGGLSDVSAGFKVACYTDKDTTATFQFRAIAPTGAVRKGLGTGHATLKPAFLLFRRLTDRLASESELHLWMPVGGTAGFESAVIGHGTGLSYAAYEGEFVTVAPVVELFSWTFLNGQKENVLPSGVPVVLSAAGDTIVNLKGGVRMRYQDVGDVYAGYGRALTGDTLYKNLFRLEFRLFY